MTLNKVLYRQAYQQYQQAETHQQQRRHQPRSLGEAWRQYLDLVEFCQLLCPNRTANATGTKNSPRYRPITNGFVS